MQAAVQADTTVQPWDFSRMANYASAMPVETVHADSLSEQQFWQQYVARNRPCLVVGAAAHWPGCQKWTSLAYLKGAAGNVEMEARSVPVFEFPPTPESDQESLDRRAAYATVKMPFHTFLERAFHGSGQLVVHSVPLEEGSPFDALRRDIGSFKFLPRPRKPRGYVPLRAFFYRDSYTDFHYHPADETLMAQVTGSKEVMLFPPDQATWDALDPVVREKGYLYDIDRARFPAAAALRPYRVVVQAGDALFIPVYWWHAVGSADPDFGVTVATTFASPLHVAGDLRYPVARLVFKGLLRSPLMPLALVAAGYAWCRRMLSPGSRAGAS